MAPTERIGLVSQENESLTVKRQCELAEVNRSSVYREQRKSNQEAEQKETSENLDMMLIIDQMHLKCPSWGYRKMTDYLRNVHGYIIVYT